MDEEMVETDNLVTVKHFAKIVGVSPSYLYQLEKDGQIPFVMIDGVGFVDILKNKSFINKSSRKVTRKINRILSKTKNIKDEGYNKS